MWQRRKLRAFHWHLPSNASGRKGIIWAFNRVKVLYGGILSRNGDFKKATQVVAEKVVCGREKKSSEMRSRGGISGDNNSRSPSVSESDTDFDSAGEETRRLMQELSGGILFANECGK